MDQYLWILRFPIVLSYTLFAKVKNGKLFGSDKDYKDHQVEFYSHPLTTDKSDKFHKERKRISKLTRSEGKNKSVLELGTGAGWQAIDFEKEGFDIVTAIDLVPKRIEFCKALHKGAKTEFKVMDATSLDYEDNSFDAVVFSAMLHDIARTPRVKALKEAMRVAKNSVVVFEPKNYKPSIKGFIYGLVGEMLDESSSFIDYVNHNIDYEFEKNGWKLASSEFAWHNMLSIRVYENTSNR